MDDGAAAISVNLRKCLVVDPEQRARPLTRDERTAHILPVENNLLQHIINDTEQFTFENRMQINRKKTTVMKFNRSRKYDFPPELCLSDDVNLEVVSEAKMLRGCHGDQQTWRLVS